jgi:cytochrome oxidase Cu insertion factor (SCO1/SenC/PrrC family)
MRPMRSRNTAATLLALLTTISVAMASVSISYATKGDYLPDIRLTDQNSRAISLAALRGKPVLVGFIHTMCEGVCQMMIGNMRAVTSMLPEHQLTDVTMLLITTDPADDRPPQLLEYAKAQGLQGKQWVIVTGPASSISRVMRLYGVKHEDSDDAMMHVMKLFLIAPDGSLAHVYPGMKLSPQMIATDIENLSRRHRPLEPTGSGQLR